MTPVIIQHHGTIMEFIGDAIFALRRAVQPRGRRRARGLLRVGHADALAAMNEEDRRRGSARSCAWASRCTSVRRGRNIGSHDRVKYGVVGRR
jgi:class 3 adenylate cyclase